MLPQTISEELEDGDFPGARRRATLRRLAAWLRRESGADRLLPVEEARGFLGALVEVHRGVPWVPAEKIVGSVARSRDFDGAFLPPRPDLAERWKRIDRLAHGPEELPAVVLYEVGDAYYVLDGRFSVSVARYYGAAVIAIPSAELVDARRELSTEAVSGGAS